MGEQISGDVFLSIGSTVRSIFVKKTELGCLLLSPPQDRATDRHSLLHTAGTIREQFGNRYASTVW